jgi:ABC-type polysaccharide/polyol phosphate export permease
MGNYLGAIWRCRFFWLSLVKMDLRTRYRRSILGMGWALLHPIAMTATICAVFQHLMAMDVWHYAPYLLAGLACWNYILSSTTTGCQSLLQGESYIRQYPAPIAIYPLRTTLGATIHFLIALAVVLGLMWYIKHSAFSVLPLFSLAPTLVLLFVFCWSLAVLAGFANVYFQDTQHLCEVGFQIFFYMTPIIYDKQLLEGKRMEWVVRYNPLVPILDLIREPVVEGRFPTPLMYALASVTVALVAGAAVLALVRLQRRVIFYM